MWKNEIGIGILGLGHVGRGTLDIMEKNQTFIEQEISPYKIKIISLADLDVKRKPKTEMNNIIFTTSAQQVIEHPEVRIVVEAIGSEFPSYDLIKQALEAGKHVVTPNKEVVAKHGFDLLRIAHQNQVQFLFETSVGSAIPILGVISKILTSCPLDEITGIINSTTNYILDLMFEEKMSLTQALKKAQEMGYAEADPTKDIQGLDALYKIFILSALGFRTRLDLDQIAYKGIHEIAHEDIQLAKQLGYRIKLIATARKIKDHLDVQVQPLLVVQDHLLAHIRGVNNGIFLYGESYGELFFSGEGAGGIAGGSMIVSDIVRIIRQPQYFEYGFLIQDSPELKMKPLVQEENAYFLRIQLIEGQNYANKLENLLAKIGIPIEKWVIMVLKDYQCTAGILTRLLKKDKVMEAVNRINQQSNGFKVMNVMSVYKDIRNK